MAEISCNLSSCFLCAHCLPEWKELVAVKKKTLLFKKGKEIFREGSPVQGMFFIYSGSVKIFKQWGEHKELIVRFARSGDVLGYRGWGDAVYPITSITLEETKVCYIPNDLFDASLKTNTAFTYRLMQVYANDLQKAEERMRDLAHMDVKGRIAMALLEVAELFGLDQHHYITIPLTRQDLASYAGTAYETVFKFFSELSSANILSITGKRIRINHPEKLRQFLVNKTGQPASHPPKK